MRRTQFLFIFLILPCLLLSQVSFDLDFSLEKIDQDDEIVNLWLADYDEDNQDEIYISYISSDYWRLVVYNQIGDTLSVLNQSSTYEMKFSSCKLVKLNDTVYLIVVYDQIIFNYRYCILNIYEFENMDLIDSDTIEIGDYYYIMGHYFYTSYIKHIFYDNMNYIYLGLRKGYDWDEDGSWGSPMYKYSFDQVSLDLIESINSCGYGLLSYTENDSLIAFGYHGSWSYSGFYSKSYSIKLVSYNSPIVTEDIVTVTDDNYNMYLKHLTQNDLNYIDYGMIIWIYKDHSQQFRCYSPDLSQILWEKTATDSIIKSYTCVNTNLGNHFILYFYEDDNTLEVRDRITGNVKLSQSSEIMPTQILRNSNGDLLFFVDNDSTIDVYTLSAEIQVPTEEFIIDSNILKIRNHPNPFNPSTTISYHLPEVSRVSLSIYNIKGQLVRALVNDIKSAGEHSVIWDGTDRLNDSVPSGVYLYRLKTKNDSRIKKMILLR